MGVCALLLMVMMVAVHYRYCNRGGGGGGDNVGATLCLNCISFFLFFGSEYISVCTSGL